MTIVDHVAEGLAAGDATDTTPGFLIWLDPKTLAAHPGNIRRSSGDLEGLKASMAELGMLEPISMVGKADAYRIRAGHRRLEAALELDWPLVPCFVRADDGSSDLAAMAAENLQRKDLTVAEEAEAYVQLQAEGLDVAEISRRTGIGTDRIGAGIKAAGSKPAMQAATKHPDLTLDQAVTFSEFEADKHAVRELLTAVKDRPAQFDHVAAQLRQVAEAKALYEAECSKLQSAGIKIAPKDTAQGWNPARPNCALGYLATAEGKELTPASHKECPGHTAIVIQSYRGEPRVVYVCADPKKNGHKSRSSAPPKPTLTPAQREQAKNDRAAAATAAEEAKRRQADWAAATSVRHEHLVKLLQRKVTPKPVLRWTLEAIANDPWLPGEGEDSGILEVLVGSTTTRALAKKASDQALPLVITGLAVAGVEQFCQENSDIVELLVKPGWEDQRATVRTYLEMLVTTGYTLADVEQLVVAKPAAAKKAVKKAAAK